MKFNSTIFRKYDIRGIYPYELNTEIAEKIAYAFAQLYPNAKKIVIARDPRISSEPLHNSIVNALINSNKTIFDLGIAPDPLFYFAIFHYNLDGGIMISGSHNTKSYNGIMMNIRSKNNKTWHDIIGQELEHIKHIIAKNKIRKSSNCKGNIQQIDISNNYIKYVTNKITLKKPLKIAIDSSNGACGKLPKKILEALGCKVTSIYDNFNGNFPNHAPNPYNISNLRDIKKLVLDTKSDIGFCFDADGDRVAPIDNKGKIVSGDACLLMLANNALQKHNGPIVHGMRISQAFLDAMKLKKVKTYFSVSHHNAIIKKIIEKNAVFGGEITYHFLFPKDYYLCDEAIFSSLKIAEIASAKNSFANYANSLIKYYASPEIFIKSSDTQKYKIIKKLQLYLKKNKYKFIGIDGARIQFNHGWALIRASNTSPLIKLRFEGKTKKDLNNIQQITETIFKKAKLNALQSANWININNPATRN